MSFLRLRPSADLVAGATVLHGAANNYAALADDDPSSYITFPDGTNPDPMAVNMEEAVGIPADAKVVGLGVITETSGIVNTLQYVLSSQSSVIGPPSDPHYLIFNENITWLTQTLNTPIFDWPIRATPLGMVLALHRTDGFVTPCNIYEFTVGISYLNKPVVVVGQPTGTINDTNSPDVAWLLQFDMPDENAVVPGYGMTAFEAKIFDSATYSDPDFDMATSTPVLQSGIRTDGVTVPSIFGPGSRWSFSETLPNGDYKAAVRAAQTIEGAYWWSDWDLGPLFTINPPTPNPPALTVVADDAAGAIAIDVSAGDLSLDAVSTDWIEVQKSLDGGRTWGPIRTLQGYKGVVLPQYRDATVDDLKEAIVGLAPQLYWPLDLADGVTDISGHGRNGTAVGGPSIGLSAALTACEDDSSTTFDGVDDKITSTYAPFVAGRILTVIGMAFRTNHASIDPLFTTSTGVVWLGLASGNQNAQFYPDATAHVTTWTAAWPGDGQAVFWAWDFSEAIDVAFFFPNAVPLLGSNAGPYSGGGSGNFQIGGDGANWFGGKLAHVAVFDRGISPAELAGLNTLITTGQSAFF